MPPIPPPRACGSTTTTPVPLYWVEYGDPNAPPILLLHGGPAASHDYLLPQMLALAEEHRLVTYDQRGGGRSRHDDDRAAIGWRDQVEDVARVAAELRLDPLTIVGYSWGGLLAMLYATEAAAGRVAPAPARLALIDPAPIDRPARLAFEQELARRQAAPEVAALRAELQASGLREREPDAYRQRAFELSVAGYFADPARARDLTPFRVTGRVQQSIWQSLGEYDLRDSLKSVRVPTLVVHGRQDPIPLASSEAAARALGTTCVVIEDSGHVPYVEQPAQLFPLLRAFLHDEGSPPPAAT
ncbi:MAG TPA: alpha/beta fold hydrolase [Gemmatimonadaceae bacterium]|nr:alpha/beta fold hydrolase [Gemmatimonadaceae bacterium]